jgi:hypothetical protein
MEDDDAANIVKRLRPCALLASPAIDEIDVKNCQSFHVLVIG